jgi:hypothetical protein
LTKRAYAEKEREKNLIAKEIISKLDPNSRQQLKIYITGRTDHSELNNVIRTAATSCEGRNDLNYEINIIDDWLNPREPQVINDPILPLVLLAMKILLETQENEDIIMFVTSKTFYKTLTSQKQDIEDTDFLSTKSPNEWRHLCGLINKRTARTEIELTNKISPQLTERLQEAKNSPLTDPQEHPKRKYQTLEKI